MPNEQTASPSKTAKQPLRPGERKRDPRVSIIALGVWVATGALSGCLEEGPAGLGELVLASDGIQDAVLADGPFGDGPPPSDGASGGAPSVQGRRLLVYGRLRDSDAGVFPSLYLIEGGTARWLVDNAVLFAHPWGQDGSSWFATYGICNVDHNGSLDCPTDALERLGPDGQLTEVLSGGRLATFEHVGPWTSATLGDGRSLVRRDDGVEVAAQGSLLPLGRWYFAASASDRHTLVRFSDDDPMPQVVATKVTSWSSLPVMPRPLGWLIVKTDAGALLVDPDTLESQPLPVDPNFMRDVSVRPDRSMIASFWTTPGGAGPRMSGLAFVDPLTWKVQSPTFSLAPDSFDTWRATWRPDTDELWVGTTGEAPTLFAFSPSAPDVMGDLPRQTAQLQGLDVAGEKRSPDDHNSELLSHSGLYAPFLGFGTSVSSDGKELLVSSGRADAWLDWNAVETPHLRPVLPNGLDTDWVIETGTPGSAWALGTESEEASLWFSARAPSPEEPPRMQQVARRVSMVWVGATRALAIVRNVGGRGGWGNGAGTSAGGHGDLVLLDPQGGETWIASNVISFTPVPSCAGCDALAPGSRLIYIVNASRPWHRNGVWECTLP